jgi:uncharacterized protein
MRRQLRILWALLGCFCVDSKVALAEEPAPLPQMATISAEMQADIRQLLLLLQPDATINQVIDQVVAVMKRRAPKVPAQYWERARAKLTPEPLREMTIPFYAKYYTHEDIKQLLVFMQTPIGEKFRATEPKIFQETFVAGREWGIRIGQQIAKDIKAEGYEIAL